MKGIKGFVDVSSLIKTWLSEITKLDDEIIQAEQVI